MRVRINDFWLAGDPSVSEDRHTSCNNDAFTGSRSQGSLEGVEWDFADFQDFENHAEMVDFDTSRLFDSPEECEAFIFNYYTAHAWSGTVTFRIDDEDGTWQEYHMPSAVIEPP